VNRSTDDQLPTSKPLITPEEDSFEDDDGKIDDGSVGTCKARYPFTGELTILVVLVVSQLGTL
jgi:hypothetical protein